MADYGNILDAIRAGENIDNIDLSSLVQRDNKGSPPSQGSSSAIMPVALSPAVAESPTSHITAMLSSGSSSGGKGPSQNMADANAFIRANRNRDENGNQVAALLSPGNTEGGVARVNANTGTYGVRAEVGPDGQILLTNVGVTKPVPNTPVSPSGVGPGTGIIAPNTPLSVQSLYNTLLKADDIDTARGTLASLRNAAALETSKYENQAVQFAENQLGIPKLQAELQAAMAADLSDPKYTPGMGDSRYTAAIRTTLEDARNRALINSKVYLNNNPDYATLGATLKNADSEVARLTKVGDRKSAIADQTTAELERQKNIINFKAQETAQAMDAGMQQNIIMLNPELKDMNADDKMLQMGKIFTARASKDKAWAEAVTATPDQLPSLALSGNAYATRLTVSKEMANTGESESVIKAKLDDVQKLALNPKFSSDLVKKFFGEDKQGKQQYQAYIDTLNSKLGTPDSKKAQDQMRFNMALAIERKNTTIKFAGDLGQWKVDPAMTRDAEAIFPGSSAFFTDAVTQTRKVVGRADMMSVFNQYIGDAQGPEKIKKGQAFVEILKANAMSKTDSMFGVPDARALTTQLNMDVSKNIFRKIYQAAGEQFGRTMDIMPTTGLKEGLQAGAEHFNDAPVELDRNAVQ